MKNLYCKKNGLLIASNLEIATTMIERMKGLMFRKEFGKHGGLIIESCNSIHTFFMNFPIDIIFVNHNYKVIKIIHQLHPYRLSCIYFKASRTIELPAGTIGNKIQKDDELEVRDV